jgi:hypothetical protein
LNVIDHRMPGELRRAVELADPEVHVIVLQGAGKGFCGGYYLGLFAEAPGEVAGSQDMPWDPTEDYAMMSRNTQDFMALWLENGQREDTDGHKDTDTGIGYALPARQLTTGVQSCHWKYGTHGAGAAGSLLAVAAMAGAGHKRFAVDSVSDCAALA